MESPVRLLVHGGNGRMGQAVQRLCREDPGCVVVAAVSRKVGPRVRPFYAAARKEALYAEQRGRPMVLALVFARDG